MNDNNSIIVPIDVQALCVGDTTNVLFIETPYLFSKLENYGDPLSPNDPFLSSNFMSGETIKSSESGIYLHWALPAGLVMGIANQGSLEFPQVPNRWVITRVIKHGTGIDTKQWLVESDYIAKDNTDSDTAILHIEGNNFMKYQGRVIDLDNVSALEAASGAYLNQLNAIGFGLPEFSSFFKQCRNVFGLYDKLDKIEKGTISYNVVGYYAENTQQLLINFVKKKPKKGKAVNNIAVELGWIKDTQTDMDQADPKIYLSGLVGGIEWNKVRNYETSSTNDIQIGIGNSHEEALSLLATNNDSLHQTKLLHGFQIDLLDSILNTPSNEDIERTDKDLFQDRFLGKYAGIQYQIRYQQTKDKSKEKEVDFAEISRLLNQLNEAQYAYDSQQEVIESAKLHIYLHWRCFIGKREINKTSMSSDIYDYLTAALTRLGDLQKELPNLTHYTTPLQTELNKTPNLLELITVPAERYWQAKEPTLIFKGSQIKVAKRYANNGSEEPCTGRNLTELRTKVTVSGQREIKPFDSVKIDDKLPNRDILKKIIIDLLLQDKSLVDCYCSQGIGQCIYDGKEMAEIGITDWKENPWLPFQLSWGIGYESSIKTINEKLEASAFQSYSYNADKLEFEMPQTPECQPSHSYDNSITLSDMASKNFQKRYKQLFLNEPAPDLPDTLAQNLAGLNHALLQMRDELQFQVADFITQDPDIQKFSNETIKTSVGEVDKYTLNHSKTPYNPIRCGRIHLEKLYIIDAFGKFCSVDINEIKKHNKLKIAQSLQSIDGKDISLPPRIVQPCRLLTKWLSAADEKQVFNNLPVSNPIYAFLMPNYIDSSIWFFTPQGKLLGAMSLSENTKDVLWITPPSAGQYATFNDFKQSAEYKSLSEKLQDLLDFFSKLDNLNDFLDKSKDAINVSLAPNFKQFYSNTMLLGQPIAIADITLELDLKGIYAQDYGDKLYPEVIEKGAGKDPVFDWATRGFELVNFPVLVGNADNTSDGLIAFTENNDLKQLKYLGEKDAAGKITEHHIHISLEQQKGGKQERMKRKLTLFFDPRNKIQLRPAILPWQNLQLPPDTYTEILDKMQLAFQVTPVLSYANQLAFPTPDAGNKTWEWRQANEDHTWSNARDIKSIPLSLEDSFVDILEGWVKIKP